MLPFIARRILYSAAVLVASSLLVFALVDQTKGQAAGIYGTPSVAYASYPQIVARRHLDRPILVQYGDWAATR